MAKLNLSDSCQQWTWVLFEGHRTHFQCYWTEFTTAQHGLQIATDHKLRRQGFMICRNLWLSQFVTVQNTTSQIDVNSARGYTPKYSKHVHIDIGPFQKGFLGTSFMYFVTDIQAHKQIPERVLSVIGLSLCRHGLDHKLRQITNCEGRDSWFVFWVFGRVPMFTFGMNMKSCIFAHFGVISLLYLFVCSHSSYKARNRCTKETFLIVSDVDMNMLAALRSIPSGTADFSEFVIKIQKFHSGTNIWNISFANWRSFCLGGDVLIETVAAILYRYETLLLTCKALNVTEWLLQIVERLCFGDWGEFDSIGPTTDLKHSCVTVQWDLCPIEPIVMLCPGDIWIIF